MGSRSPEALVEPTILRWARETAHLEIAQAAKKLSVDASKLMAWEEGSAKPSVVQLDKISDVYHRPLGVFYLSRPPTEPAPPADFRKRSRGKISSDLAYQIRAARERRKVALSLAPERPEPFALQADTQEDAELVGMRTRRALGINTMDDNPSGLNGWKDLVERADVLVFETARVKSDETRGFSIFERLLPVIVLNGSETDTGRLFTLGQELTHLMLGSAGVCGDSDSAVEKFCDRVSAAILMPGEPFKGEFLRHVGNPAGTIAKKLGRAFGVSEEASVMRLRDLSLVKADVAGALLSEINRLRQKRDEKETDGFAPYFRMLQKRLGNRYAREVIGALERNAITFLDASRYLGTSTDHVEKLMEHVWAPR